jgi:hypothetical protein
LRALRDGKEDDQILEHVATLRARVTALDAIITESRFPKEITDEVLAKLNEWVVGVRLGKLAQTTSADSKVQ